MSGSVAARVKDSLLGLAQKASNPCKGLSKGLGLARGRGSMTLALVRRVTLITKRPGGVRGRLHNRARIDGVISL